MIELKKREWVYVHLPSKFDIAPCKCGNTDLQWSEFEEHLWCDRCQKDFIPEHWGIFDGPIGWETIKLFGISFTRYNLTNGKYYDPVLNGDKIDYVERVRD